MQCSRKDRDRVCEKLSLFIRGKTSRQFGEYQIYSPLFHAGPETRIGQLSEMARNHFRLLEIGIVFESFMRVAEQGDYPGEFLMFRCSLHGMIRFIDGESNYA